MRAPALWTAYLILLAGCANGPAVSERTVAAPPAVVLERIGAKLDALGFTRSGGQPGALAARSDRSLPAWATCSPALVGDGDDRRVMVSAERRYAEVRVTAAPAGGQAAVSIDAGFRADYRNRLRAASFQRRCRTTGTLEALLLAAASG